ncbi:MAG: hypothetical protein ACXWXF_04915 [Aeromicrobium sp.]
MSSVRLLRRTLAIAVSATALLVLTGCGFGAQTNQSYDAAVGSNERGGKIKVLNALYVDNADGTATFSATLLNKDTGAHVLGAVTATSGDGSPITATLAAPVELEPQVPYTPGTNGDIMLTGAFAAGGFVKTTLTFEGAEPVTIDAPVVARNAAYEGVATKKTDAPKTDAATG